MQYIQDCLLTKQNFFWCFDAGLEHMASRSRGNGPNFDWLRKSCDISTCDLSPDGNPEKYRRPMKSAIVDRLSQRPRTFQIVISCFPYKHIPNLLLVYRLMLSSDNHTTLLQTITFIE